jgi:hypothetical protein
MEPGESLRSTTFNSQEEQEDPENRTDKEA